MSCIQRITRITLAITLAAALLAVTPAPATAAGPRTDQAAPAADDTGSSPSWTPWRLLESLLRSVSGADEDPAEEENEGSETGGEDTGDGGTLSEPPSESPQCPTQQTPGPCIDPTG